MQEFKALGKDDLQRYLYIASRNMSRHFVYFNAENSIIPGMKSLDVSDISYVMGLLDCIGEIKRMIIDKLGPKVLQM